MMEFLRQVNWVDIVVLALLVRIVYVSAKDGFVTELIKTLGVLLACFFAFHYYTRLAAWAGKSTDMSLSVLEVVLFGVIWMVIFWIFQLLRSGLSMIFTVETVSLVDRWGAVIVSLGRFFLTASMVLFIFLLTDHPYMEKMTATSLSQPYVLRAAPGMYAQMTRGIVIKFFPQQRINPSVADELGETAIR